MKKDPYENEPGEDRFGNPIENVDKWGHPAGRPASRIEKIDAIARRELINEDSDYGQECCLDYESVLLRTHKIIEEIFDEYEAEIEKERIRADTAMQMHAQAFAGLGSDLSEMRREINDHHAGLADHIVAHCGNSGNRGRPPKYVPAIREAQIANFNKWIEDHPEVSRPKRIEYYSRDLLGLSEFTNELTDDQTTKLKAKMASLRALIDADRQAKKRAKAKDRTK